MLKVTDFGRLTVVQDTMVHLQDAVAEGKAILESNGHTFVLQKNTLGAKVDTTIGGGFRNLHTLVKMSGTGMIVEVQWTLTELEAIKHSAIGL